MSQASKSYLTGETAGGGNEVKDGDPVKLQMSFVTLIYKLCKLDSGCVSGDETGVELDLKHLHGCHLKVTEEFRLRHIYFWCVCVCLHTLAWRRPPSVDLAWYITTSMSPWTVTLRGISAFPSSILKSLPRTKHCVKWNFTKQVLGRVNSLHPVVFLWRGEDSLVSDINLTERSAPVSLLVEQRHRCHGDGTDDYGLAVGNDGLFRHHVTHVLNVPATKQQPEHTGLALVIAQQFHLIPMISTLKSAHLFINMFCNKSWIFLHVYTSCARVICQVGSASLRTCRRPPQLW